MVKFSYKSVSTKTNTQSTKYKTKYRTKKELY